MKLGRRFICCLIIGFIILTFPLNTLDFHDVNSESASTGDVTSIERPPSRAALSIAFSQVEWSYSSRENTNLRQLTSAELTGDHVVLHAESDEPLVSTSKLHFTPTTSTRRYLRIPAEDFDPFTDLIPMNSQNVAWFMLPYVEPDTVITIVGRFSTSNCDFMAWDTSINHTTWRYSNNILGSSMATSSYPEGASFTRQEGWGSILVACINHDRTDGWAELDFYKEYDADVRASGRTVSFDTYSLDQNVTTDVVYLGISSASTLEKVAFLPNMTFNNYFTPNVTQFPPLDIGDNKINFTWTCTDRNQDDTNYYSLMLSLDHGFTYMNLVDNLTDTFYVWDSTGFSELDYYLSKIRAYSLDFTREENCTVDDPPTSYWPGDYRDSNWFRFSAGDDPVLPPVEYEIDSPADFTYQEFSTGNLIVWHPIFRYFTGYMVSYQVRHDSEMWTYGEIDPRISDIIEVNVDGLEPGEHRFTIQFLGLYQMSDYVIVTVIGTSGSDDFMTQLVRYGAYSISIGSSIVIIAVILQTVRLKRDYDSKLMNH